MDGKTTQPEYHLMSDSSSVVSDLPDSSDAVEHQQEYLDLLRRIPQSALSESIVTISTESDSTARMIVAILQLPHEIIQYVLYWLDPSDILALRLTSRILHNLVHSSERDICLSLADRVQRDYHFQLPRFLTIRNFSQFFEHHFSIEAICKVADVTAGRISKSLRYKPVLTDPPATEVWRQRKYLQLQSHLRRAYYILQMYLDFISKTVINEDQHFRYFTDEEFSSLHNIYDLDQQDFFGQALDWLTEDDFISVSCSLKIFKALCKSRKVPFGLSSRAYPFASVRQILFYKGLVPFARLLADDIDTVKQEMILRELATDLTGQKKSKLHASQQKLVSLRSICHITPSEDSSHSVHRIVHRSIGTRNEFFLNQDLWDKSGRAYMMRKLGRFPNLQSVTTWLTQTLEEPGDKRGDVILGTWDQIS